MNKYTIAEVPEANIDAPVLYRIHIGSKYYLHKGKTLKESLDLFLDNCFRGLRGKSYNPAYINFIDYCRRYPALHKVEAEVVFNGAPDKLLALETKMYKTMKNDEATLNNLEIKPYQPEWMLKEKFQKRCDECIKVGFIDGKAQKFNFCPMCGKSIKK